MTYIIAIETALILLILFVSLSFTIPKLVITKIIMKTQVPSIYQILLSTTLRQS